MASVLTENEVPEVEVRGDEAIIHYKDNEQESRTPQERRVKLPDAKWA